MKKRSLMFTIAITAIGLVFAATAIHAGTEVSDVIELNNPAYKKHTKGIVKFTHKKHAEEYAVANPEQYKNKCGECHHDDKGKPLDLKTGDDVQSCLECHKETGKLSKADKKMKKAEKIKKYHKEALHANCIGCHKAFNKKKKLKKNNPKATPTTCKQCHPKKKKK